MMTESSTQQPGSPANPLASDPAEPPPAHPGSAPVQLSGPTVLATWLTSVALHAAIFAVMFLLPWLSATIVEEEEPVTRAELIGSLEPTTYTPVPQPDFQPTASPIDSPPTEVPPDRFDQLAQLDTPKRPELSIIGIGAGGGDFSQYGLDVGGQRGPEFFGLGGSAREARSVVFVVDRSGSMMETFDAVRQELRRSISSLRRSQKFHVIFFAQDTLENPPGRLVSAIRAQKEAFFDFLDEVTPAGHTEPTQAMQRALELKPDLVYFLTDGQFDPALLPKLDRWNADRAVQIFTIAYVSREGAELLERIAREHGGEFRFVSEDEIFP